jgi:hypothetical protein
MDKGGDFDRTWVRLTKHVRSEKIESQGLKPFPPVEN